MNMQIYRTSFVPRSNGLACPPGDTDLCTICLDPLGGAVKYLPCGHGFHNACIDTWGARSHLCPVCKRDVGEVMRNTVPRTVPSNGNDNANSGGVEDAGQHLEQQPPNAAETETEAEVRAAGDNPEADRREPRGTNL